MFFDVRHFPEPPRRPVKRYGLADGRENFALRNVPGTLYVDASDLVGSQEGQVRQTLAVVYRCHRPGEMKV